METLAHIALGLTLASVAVTCSAEGNGAATSTEPEQEFPPGWTFVRIKPGSFTMGSPLGEPGRADDERQRKVKLTRVFWISAHETTQAQYEELMGRNPSRLRGAKRPIEHVSWEDAQEFVRKLNERECQAGRLAKSAVYRLPTEAEWEYACRAGTDTAYCFGNGAEALFNYGWYEGNSERRTHDVGQKRANGLGLFDMHGNVWEWCMDCYGPYKEGDVTDPVGPASAETRVLRGGSWGGSAAYCRSAARHSGAADAKGVNIGFRVIFVRGS